MPLAVVGPKYTDAATRAAIESDFNILDPIKNKISEIKTEKADTLNNIISGVAQVLDKSVPAAIAAASTLQYKGTQSSFLSFTRPIYLQEKYRAVTADNSDRIGYPTQRVRQLSGLTGFVLCENAVIAISGTVDEEQAIEDLLNRGIFIE